MLIFISFTDSREISFDKIKILMIMLKKRVLIILKFKYIIHVHYFSGKI